MKLGEVELNAALQPHNLGDFSIQQISTVLDALALSSLDELLREIGLGNQSASIIAYQFVGVPLESANTQNFEFESKNTYYCTNASW